MKPVMSAILGISPSKATVRYGLWIAMVGVPAWSQAIDPFKESVRWVVPVLPKVGVPAHVSTLPMARSLLSTSRRVPDAMETAPAPSGPERPAPPWGTAAAPPMMMPPPLTVRPLKSLTPESCSRPPPVLTMLAPAPVTDEPIARVAWMSV